MASQWSVIARREFLERVRTKWFIIVTLLGPIGLIGIIVIPAYLGAKSAEKGTTIEVVDRSGRDLGAKIVAVAAKRGSRYRVSLADPDLAESELLSRIENQTIDGFLVLPEDILERGGAVYRGDNAASISVRQQLTVLLYYALAQTRAVDAGIDETKISRILEEPVGLEMIHTAGSAEGSSGTASLIAGYIVMFLLYMAILLYAMNVMRGVLLEKTSKVVEIIISAAKPRALMLGKIIGVGGVGLAQLALWALLAIVLIEFREPILSLFGVEGAGAVALPQLSVADFAVVLAYFLLGFFLYAALYAAIGAMVSSEQEAGQLQTPVVLLLVIPVLCVQIVADDPRGGIASGLTLFPFSSPVLMPMRYLLDGAGPVELILSLAILVLTIAAVVWTAARIYRVGILMTGKRPSFREILRWLRH